MYETINSPINYGGLELKNRIIFAPTTFGLAEDEYFEKIRKIAAGGCAMVIIGDVPVGKSQFEKSLFDKKGFAHYQKLGIDPLSKVLVFSDNLDLAKAVDLYRHFASRVKLSFGIGTRLTCDLPQVKPLNIVIKLVECNGKPVAKLSDSPGKTICHDKAFVRALRTRRYVFRTSSRARRGSFRSISP